MGLLGPVRGSERNEEASSSQSGWSPAPRSTKRAASDQRGRCHAQRTKDRPGLDDLSKVDRPGFLDRLPDGCFAQGPGTIAIIVGVHVHELDHARQAVVQPRPPLLRSARRCRDRQTGRTAGGAHRDMLARGPRRTIAASRAALITASRWNSQSANPARITSGKIRPRTQESPCNANSRLTETRSCPDSRFQLTRSHRDLRVRPCRPIINWSSAVRLLSYHRPSDGRNQDPPNRIIPFVGVS